MPAHTVVDARAARWSGRTDFPVRLGGGSGICLTGGEIRGTFSPNATWRHMHGTAGLVISSPDATVTGVRIDNYGDGVRFVRNAKDFTVNAAHFSHIRDDCVENDWLRSGIVNDTLLDGCYSAFSSRPYEGQHGRPDGRDNVVTVTNTLVRLQPMNRVYRNRGRVPGHDGFFKWHRRSPRLSLQHNVFRADQPANNVGLAVPLDKVVSCSGNVMVWLGAGEYPGSLPRCFRITRDRSVWDHAVNDWKRRHGHLS